MTSTLPDCGALIFSHRKMLAGEVAKWCRERNVELCPLNVVTALNEMGLIYKTAAKRVISELDSDATEPETVG